MKTKKTFSLILMHIGFLIYSLYSLLGKIASRFEFLSLNFILIYGLLIFILFLYAIIWQQVLKNIDLSVATANKAATIIWGMIWGICFFNEQLSVKKILAIVLIFSGIIILSMTDKKT